MEEEIMLLDPDGWALDKSSDEVLGRLSEELQHHTAPETHAGVAELVTGVHTNVDGAIEELAWLRARLADELAAMGLAAAAAGTHPLMVGEETVLSGAARYRALGDSLQLLARREPTMALHVHVGVPSREDAIRLLNGLRRHIPALLALSANSPFSQGRDGGFASARTVIFQAFPRTGLPRSFSDYADYVQALDGLIVSGAVPDPSFVWWDVRPQPRLGTVEVRVMDAQSTIADNAPLIALIQSLARLELEGRPADPAPGPEILAENRFLAARDGIDARLIDADAQRLIPVRETLERMIDDCGPHARALGCTAELDLVRPLVEANGAARQRAFAACHARLEHLVAHLAASFVAPARIAVAAAGTT